MKLTAAAAEFLQSLEAEGRSPHTTAAYRRDLAVFTAFTGDIDTRRRDARHAPAVHGRPQRSVCAEWRATRQGQRQSLQGYGEGLVRVGRCTVARQAQPDEHPALPATSWAATCDPRR
jgi:site-specific recombinase XerC